jgi:prepilin peptidase CpaA
MLIGLDAGRGVVLLISALACWFDLRTRRIPNVLTFGGALVAIGFQVATRGLPGLLSSVAGWSVGVAIFLPLFLLRGMGAGDVKLLGCLGAWLGPLAAAWLGLYAALAGGVLALGVALAQGYLGQAVKNLWTLFAHWRVMGVRPLDELSLDRGAGPRLPYALPIAVGAVVTVWLR